MSTQFVSRSARRPDRFRAIGRFIATSAAVVIGLAIAGYTWFLGARYTVDGVIVVVNWMLLFIDAPLHIRIPLPWAWYFYLAPIPIAYSLVEFFNLPYRQEEQRRKWASLGMIIVWIVVGSMDMVTTFIGTGVPHPSTGVVGQWFALTPWVRGVVTMLLTFGPEWMARQMTHAWQDAWQQLRQVWRSV